MPDSYLNVNVHIVFATYGRTPNIEPLVLPELHAYIGGTIRGLKAEPLIVGGVADHIHALVRIRGNHCIADIVKEVRTSSNAWMREVAHVRDFAWQIGYGAWSVGHREVPDTCRYIENQPEHHRKLSSADEMRILLAAAGMEIDERHFV